MVATVVYREDEMMVYQKDAVREYIRIGPDGKPSAVRGYVRERCYTQDPPKFRVLTDKQRRRRGIWHEVHATKGGCYCFGSEAEMEEFSMYLGRKSDFTRPGVTPETCNGSKATKSVRLSRRHGMTAPS